MCNTVTTRDKQTMTTELVLSTDLFEDSVFENSRLKEWRAFEPLIYRPIQSEWALLRKVVPIV